MTIDKLPSKKHFTTSSFIVNEDRTKTLMIFHKKIKRWIYPGGHLEENELPDAAALREFKEETGLDGKLLLNGDKLDLSESTEVQLAVPYCVLSMKIKASSKDVEHTHIDFVYIIEADDSVELVSEEDSDARWFTKAELDELNTFESLREIAKNVLR